MRVLDLFSGGGGAARGYIDAGATVVVGVDIDAAMGPDFLRAVGDHGIFVAADAIEVLSDRRFLGQFDLLHASPPCQHFSRMSNCRPGLRETYPDLISPALPLLEASGRPYVLENVISPRTRELLPTAIVLCGSMFGRPLYRHRLFQAGRFDLRAPLRPALQSVPTDGRLAKPNRECGWPHPVPAARAGHWEPGKYVSPSGHERRAIVNAAMSITWMSSRENVKEAIPPAFTEWVGTQFQVAAQ